MKVLSLVDGKPPEDAVDETKVDYATKVGSVTWGLVQELENLEEAPSDWERTLAFRLAKIIDQSFKVPAALIIEYKELVKSFSADEVKKDYLGLDP